jgi:hypothetical protein
MSKNPNFVLGFEELDPYEDEVDLYPSPRTQATWPTTTTPPTTTTAHNWTNCLCPTDLTTDATGEGEGSKELFWLFVSLVMPILIGVGHGFVSSAYERLIRNRIRDDSNNDNSKKFCLNFEQILKLNSF